MHPSMPYMGHPPPMEGMAPSPLVQQNYPPGLLGYARVIGYTPMHMGYNNAQQFHRGINQPAAPQSTPLGRGVTVYIGNISKNVDSDFMKTVLDEFGKVLRWTRQSDPVTGQLATFGFCEFADVTGAGLCLEILHDMKLGGKTLKVNSNDKVRAQVSRGKEERVTAMLRNFKEKSREEVELEMHEESERIKNVVQELFDNKNEQLPLELEFETPDIKDPKTAPPPEPSVNSKPKRLDPEAIAAAAENSIYRIAPDGTDRRAYISEDYRPHRKEMERLQANTRRLAEYEREFTKREREWIIVEMELAKTRETELAAEREVGEEDRRRLISEDVRGQWWEGLDDEKRRIERKKKRHREVQDDEKDRQAEVSETQHAERKSRDMLIKPSLEPKYTSSKHSSSQKSSTNESSNGTSNSSSSRSLQAVQKVTHVPKEVPVQPVKNKRDLQVFFGEDDDHEYGEGKHKPLTRLDEHRDPTNKVQKVKETMEVIENSKRILAMVPTETAQLFSTTIDWNLLNQKNILDTKLRPWVRKKVMEFMGGEEGVVHEVIEYILSRLKEKPKPKALLEELGRFLDEEAEGFIKNIWRLIVFEQLKIQNA